MFRATCLVMRCSKERDDGRKHFDAAIEGVLRVHSKYRLNLELGIASR